MKVLLAGLFVSHFALIAAPAIANTATVDWTQSGAAVNRGLLSTHGIMQAYILPDRNAVKTWKYTNPYGTTTRLETWIGKMEPVNDNANPAVYNWPRFYHWRMLRFLESRTAFDAFVDSLGMNRLLLLCYNTGWLESGNPADPVRDKAEWAEFAAAAIRAYNGTSGNTKPVPIVELWNEPNLTFFYSGTKESFFQLYNTAATRIHSEFPGVQVCGPAVSPANDPAGYINAFLPVSGPNTDVLSYHTYGESVDKIVSDINSYVGKFRQLPGKQNGKIIVTEADYWTNGWPKIQYMFDRHFRLFAMQDLIHSVHQFCILAYNESGNYIFGMVDDKGGPIEGTFWPYYLFRGLMGNYSPVTLQSDQASFHTLASVHSNPAGANLSTAVLRNRTTSAKTLTASLKFAPLARPRVILVERVGQTGKGVSQVVPVAANSVQASIDLSFGSGEAFALTLVESGKRHLGFEDLWYQESPYLSVSANRTTLANGNSVTITARATNTTGKVWQGYLQLQGLPTAWPVLTTTSNTLRLLPGQTAVRSYRVTVNSVPPSGTLSAYIVSSVDGKARGEKIIKNNSIPVTFNMTTVQ